STVRLNNNSKLTFPKTFSSPKRAVTLKGEAYFQIASNPNKPFVVNAGKGMIRVLGTKFNVKIDSSRSKINVAVVEGTVALTEKSPDANAKAILTRNHFGILDTKSDDITIEKGNAENYLSWFTNRLIYKNMQLWKISRQLRYIYNIKIYFERNYLKEQRLTANFEQKSLNETLDVIAKTLDISLDRKSVV